ncbi:short-chain collagen C4-like [Saccostrea echinata]|uniref:short-chain collagen C4-like n=1 Tax=Saccostrea echinata TaxID=191078 RepID=UPI002A83756B|nr:short-chain collagen C4-like [Saccostrea echinata]
MLQGYLTGQLSSALGAYQVEALKRQFKSFTETMEQSMKDFKKEVEAGVNNGERDNRSTVYTRWGKKTCPSNAEIVYSGLTGGSHQDHRGAAVDPLCLPRDPEWGIYRDGTDGYKAYVFGAEYQTESFSQTSSLHDHDIPCAVCLVRNRSVSRVFPARRTCYKGWSLEYEGYLMAGWFNHAAATTYKCVDKNPDTLHGGQSNKDGYLFYHVEARCGSLKCPPYVEGRELMCAVCSKE